MRNHSISSFWFTNHKPSIYNICRTTKRKEDRQILHKEKATSELLLGKKASFSMDCITLGLHLLLKEFNEKATSSFTLNTPLYSQNVKSFSFSDIISAVIKQWQDCWFMTLNSNFHIIGLLKNEKRYTHVKSFEFRIAIDLQPPFSRITRAQSVYFLATALWSTDSPSSSTALGSAPANSNSWRSNICQNQGSLKKGMKLLKTHIFIVRSDQLKTYMHAIRLAMVCTDMSNWRTKAFSQSRSNISAPFDKSMNTFRGSSC